MQEKLSLVNKWRLILGTKAQESLPLDPDYKLNCCCSNNNLDQSRQFQRVQSGSKKSDLDLQQYDLSQIDHCLNYIYDQDSQDLDSQEATKNSYRTNINWMDVVKNLFPNNIFEIIQKDAIKFGKINEILSSEESVAKLEANKELLWLILENKSRLSEQALANARILVEKIAKDLAEHFKFKIQQSINGKHNYDLPPIRTFRNLDLKRTVKSNLKHYQMPNSQNATGFIIPQQIYFKSNVKHNPNHYLYIVVDQSGSMLSSFAYASIIASVFAKMPSLKTKLVCYDERLVDLSDQLEDLVKLLLSSQLGGGTDTSIALDYISDHLVEPNRSIMVLISDLYDADPDRMLIKTHALIEQGVKVLVLPSLGEQAQHYNQKVAQQLAAMDALVAQVSPDKLIEYIIHISQSLR